MDELAPLLLVFRLSLGAPPPPPHPAPVALPALATASASSPGVASAARAGTPAPMDPQAKGDLWFAEDKLKHFFMSFAVTGAIYGIVRSVGADGAPGLALAGAGGAAAGLWKEWRDRRAGGPFSRKDLTWDAVGIGAALVLASQTR